MASAKRLNSGNWNVQVYSHKDENGKRVYMSFTGATKQEAEMMAARYAAGKVRNTSTGMTVEMAIEKYISAKTGVLSASTIRSYRNLQKKYYKEIAKTSIIKLTNYDIQMMIAAYSESGLKPKTVKNINILLMAAINFVAPEIKFKVDLPRIPKNTKPSPKNADVAILFRMASDWMKKCIALAAFGGMRRGEIAALKYKDIEGDVIHVHSAYAMDENNKWIHQDVTKEECSDRYVRLPHQVIELLGTGLPEDYIIGYNPNTISKMYNKLRTRAGIDKSIRFHDLRHYFASIGAVLNIPDTYLADFGGWSHSSPVMKEVYQGQITDIAEGYSRKMTDYFSQNVISKAK